MKPDIILHVGTEKTGSTSIQSLLSASYDTLVKSGVLFPKSIGSPCHINLTACALGNEPQSPIRALLGLQDQGSFDNYVQATKKSLKEEIEKTSPSTLVISDEHINAHLSSVEKLKVFKTLCNEFGEIKAVIIYLRKQDELRLSLFSEAVKSGNLSSFDIINPLSVFNTNPYRFRYKVILDYLEEVFGAEKITPRVYDRSTLLDGNVVVDFLDVADIKINLREISVNEKNKSIDATVIQHLGEISSKLKEVNQGWSEKLRRIIINNCSRIFPGPGPVMDKGTHKRFMAQFDAENREVKKKYFSDSADEDLFSEDEPGKDAVRKPYPDCTISWPEFFIKYVSGMLLKKNNSAGSGIEEERVAAGTVMPEKQYAASRSNTNTVEATCPVCGASYSLDVSVNSREGKLCPACGASGRAQAIAYHVSDILCGKVIPLKKHPINRSKKIVGLSDGSVYADVLKKKYDYTNTFFHREPFLDISNPSKKYHSTLDLLITTEVFEHVIGPSIAAFRGVFEVLKPGGHIILTVPFINKGDAVEHYSPDLTGYSSHKTHQGNWVAELEFSDGHRETDTEPKFHGGPGKTLEIRLFNRARLIDELEETGFTDIVIYDENQPEHGINWGEASRVITARKPFSENR